MRFLPRSPRGTWTLAALLWAAGSALLWWQLPLRPVAEWAAPQQVWVGYIPDRRAFVSLPFAMDNPNTGPLRFWEADSGRVVEWFDADEHVIKVVVSPNGKWAAVLHGRTEPAYSFQLFETATGRVRSDLPRRADLEQVWPSFSPDSRWLAYAEQADGGTCVHVWDVDAGRVRRTLRAADGLLKVGPEVRLAFSADGRTLAVADHSREWTREGARVQLWDWDAGRVTRTLVGPAAEWLPISVGCWRLRFSPDGRHLTAEFHINEPKQTIRTEVWCWDVADGRATLQLPGQLAAVTADRLWVVDWDWAIQQQAMEGWAYSGGREHRLPADGFVSFDGTTLALASAEPHPVRDWLTARGIHWPFGMHGSVRTRLVDGATGQLRCQLPGWVETGECRPIDWTAFSPDGRLFAEAIPSGVRIWDVPPGKPLAWCAAGSALLALLIAGLARRRVRKLQRLVRFP